jgi:hypothetical protein
MAFDSPESADYRNLPPLNRQFLNLLGQDPALQRSLSRLPDALREKLCGLSAPAIDRLAETPFLLCSFREYDDVHWARILNSGGTPDLFTPQSSPAVQTMVSAGLGYAWHLARDNPFTLRLMTGAPLSWCERIAELPFHELLDAYHRSGEAPSIRLGHRQELWRLLLGPGISRRRELRRAAQLTALQAALSAPANRVAWQRAASRVRRPGLEVADGGDIGI